MTPLTTPGGEGTPGNYSWGCAARFSKSWPDQNRQSLYPFSDQNGAKTLPDGATHTYIAYIREYPPPPGYDFDFSFSQGHKRSSDSAYESDSVVNSFAISLTSVVSATP